MLLYCFVLGAAEAGGPLHELPPFGPAVDLVDIRSSAAEALQDEWWASQREQRRRGPRCGASEARIASGHR